MKKREFKSEVFNELSIIGKSLSDSTRLRILELVCHSAKSVESIVQSLDSSMATVSHHLQNLKNSKLVFSDKQGKYVFYRASPFGLKIWDCLMMEAQQEISGIQQALREEFDPDMDYTPVSLSELEKMARAKKIVLIDVRPVEEYEHAHIPGAISVPISELNDKLNHLPKSKKIVAYCRGPFCVYSKEAVEILRASGRNAYRWKESSVLNYNHLN